MHQKFLCHPLNTKELIKPELIVFGEISENLDNLLHIQHINGNHGITAHRLLYPKLIKKRPKIEYHV
ncbi:hypothetical protein NIES3585_08920 [Nodularia sp. NIES-3585]|nr:hypothetical protein NIES3585_08920 [Nodularia sp. NIES-3585]